MQSRSRRSLGGDRHGRQQVSIVTFLHSIGVRYRKLLQTYFNFVHNFCQYVHRLVGEFNVFSIEQRRLLFACGAAAGVSAGFNAPISGVFFALEVVQGAFLRPVDKITDDDDKYVGDVTDTEQQQQLYPITSSRDGLTSILLASVVSALVTRTLLADEGSLQVGAYDLRGGTQLLEIPLYLGLGAMSGAVASVFSKTAKFSSKIFVGQDGDNNDDSRSMPASLRPIGQLPPLLRPIAGGFVCGAVGLIYPQILFFGYDTLNQILASGSGGESDAAAAMSLMLLLTLLMMKIFTTSISLGSGLVGGTFAPSLFMGAMTGASYHNIVQRVFGYLKGMILANGTMENFMLPEDPQMAELVRSLLDPIMSFQMADVPAYAMVGAASVLSSLFRAPLTGSLLLFELTRDYDVILPLMASAGVGSLVGDIIDDRIELATNGQGGGLWSGPLGLGLGRFRGR
mmetsp:Transcript_39698/g.92965  ORF Transcript_39698/g.92965 Transcript_39698/m.92965 type:complete len:455 (-) Transcript_39698:500-1864(-)